MMSQGNSVMLTIDRSQVPCKQVTGTVVNADFSEGRAFSMDRGISGLSTEYSIKVRLDEPYRDWYGIEHTFGFFGNEEKRQELEALNLEIGEHVAVYLNRLSILMKVERVANS